MSASGSQVTFYVLQDNASAQRHRFVCRLVEKIHSSGKRVYLHAEDAREMQLLDDMLWTYQEGSFLPHNLTRQQVPDTPIQLGCEGDAPAEADVMINLAPQTPDFYQRYRRVAEIIDQDPLRLQQGRGRFQAYRNQGLEPETHKIGA